MIGTLFIRSYERGERVYAAMTARGGGGTTGTAAPSKASVLNPETSILLQL
jgi:energy-coupling factor transporter transmembrane protein EcfT